MANCPFAKDGSALLKEGKQEVASKNMGKGFGGRRYFFVLGFFCFFFYFSRTKQRNQIENKKKRNTTQNSNNPPIFHLLHAHSLQELCCHFSLHLRLSDLCFQGGATKTMAHIRVIGRCQSRLKSGQRHLLHLLLLLPAAGEGFPAFPWYHVLNEEELFRSRCWKSS